MFTNTESLFIILQSIEILLNFGHREIPASPEFRTSMVFPAYLGSFTVAFYTREYRGTD